MPRAEWLGEQPGRSRGQQWWMWWAGLAFLRGKEALLVEVEQAAQLKVLQPEEPSW